MRTMRRASQQLPIQDAIAILNRQTSGVLAVADEESPYAVPLSYVYDPTTNAIYFHCAKTGHKLDAIQYQSKVSFCVIDQDHVQPKAFTTLYRSVIVFGLAQILHDPAHKRYAIEQLAMKYSPNEGEARDHEIAKSFDHMHMVQLDVIKITGKAAIELIEKKDGNE